MSGDVTTFTGCFVSSLAEAVLSFMTHTSAGAGLRHESICDTELDVKLQGFALYSALLASHPETCFSLLIASQLSQAI